MAGLGGGAADSSNTVPLGADTSDELEDKKPNIIGWKGPKAAAQAVKDAAKSFAKDDGYPRA